MLFREAEQRFDGVGADRQAYRFETETGGRLELLVEIVRKLAAYRRGRDGFDEPQTVGLGVVTETSVCMRSVG